MSAPTRDSSSNEYKLIVDWVYLTTPADGDSSITSYNLQWDYGTSGFIWYDLIGVTPQAIYS